MNNELIYICIREQLKNSSNNTRAANLLSATANWQIGELADVRTCECCVKCNKELSVCVCVLKWGNHTHTAKHTGTYCMHNIPLFGLLRSPSKLIHAHATPNAHTWLVTYEAAFIAIPLARKIHPAITVQPHVIVAKASTYVWYITLLLLLLLLL